MDDKFVIYNIGTKEAQISLRQEPCVPVKPSPLLKIKKIKKNKRILQAPSSLHQKEAKPNLEVGAFVDIKI